MSSSEEDSDAFHVLEAPSPIDKDSYNRWIFCSTEKIYDFIKQV